MTTADVMRRAGRRKPGAGMWAAVLLGLLLSGCVDSAWLVRPGPQRVARAFLVTPDAPWNAVNPTLFAGRKRNALWTMNGVPLDFVAFIGGIPSGGTLFRLPTKQVKKREVPVFRSSMLLPEIAEFIEASYARALEAQEFRTLALAPFSFGGHDGFRMEFRTVLRDEVPRRGIAAGAIVDGRLYLVLYQAAELHYFAHNRERVEALLRSLSLAPARRSS
ncbi:MAG: hypothetical protein KatS3mg119_0858 [Rhodothalassiaceae bacterium]|nr:MAG: hypothetical protein KatS3mg119_0858 [Rhodothalassiaceae bacterium]